MAQALNGIADGERLLRTGQAYTVLALGRGDQAVAVLSKVNATVIPNGKEPGIHPVGPTLFDAAVRRHWDEVIVPLLRRTATGIAMDMPAFEVSVSNVSAASVQDRPIAIQGYSADAALFLACLSALLTSPVRPDILVTGHVASPSGSVRMVRQLPAKLNAAIRHGEIRSFLYPALDGDDSLDRLAAEERAGIEEALLAARNSIHIEPVHDAGELIQRAFEEWHLIAAALNHGYFTETLPANADTSSISALAANLPARFWSCLGKALRDERDGRELLQARVHFQERQGCYPQGFGTKLYQLLASIPRGIREVRVPFPLLGPDDSHRLVRLSSPCNLEDLRYFLDAVAGGRFASAAAPEQAAGELPASPAAPPANVHLRTLFEEIDSENLARRIGRPIDEARATFLLEDITARSDSDCLDAVTAYYLHMLRHTCEVPSAVKPEGAAPEALALLDRAFSREGGYKAAVAEALAGTRGRLRYVLDAVTERYRAEQQEKYVAWVFKRTLTALEYDQRVALVNGFVQLLGPMLPEGIRNAPGARYLEHVETLARTYIQAMGDLKQIFRAL